MRVKVQGKVGLELRRLSTGVWVLEAELILGKYQAGKGSAYLPTGQVRLLTQKIRNRIAGALGRAGGYLTLKFEPPEKPKEAVLSVGDLSFPISLKELDRLCKMIEELLERA